MKLALDRELQWLLAGVLGLLLVATLVGLVLRARTRGKPGEATVANLNARVRAWWVMCAVFALTLAAGRAGSMVLFGCLSFLALREI